MIFLFKAASLINKGLQRNKLNIQVSIQRNLCSVFAGSFVFLYFCTPSRKENGKMEVVAQLVRASDCGSEGRGFESPQSP